MVKNQERSSHGSARGRGKVILVKNTQNLLHNKGLVSRGTYFARTLSDLDIEGFPAPDISNFPVHLRRNAKQHCEGHSVGTQVP